MAADGGEALPQTGPRLALPSRRFRMREPKVNSIRQFADLVLIWASLYITFRTYNWQVPWSMRESAAAAFACLLFYVVGHARRLYQLRGAAPQPLAMFRSLCTSWACVIAPLLTAAFMTKTTSSYSRVAIIAWFALTPVLLCSSRVSLFWSGKRRRSGPRRVAVVGVCRAAHELSQHIRSNPASGMRFLGVYDDRHVARHEQLAEHPMTHHGPVSALIESARRGEVDVVYIALPLRAEARINTILRELQDTTASVYLALDFAPMHGSGPQRLQVIGDVLVLPVLGGRPKPSRRRRLPPATLRPRRPVPEPAPSESPLLG